MIDSSSSYSVQTELSNKKKSPIIIIVVILILVLIGAYFLFRPSEEKDKPDTTFTKKTSPTPSPTPTEKPKIDKEYVKIQVINGTGTPGQAASAVELLTKAGYNPDNIETGNAEEFDQTNTTVAYKEGFKAEADDIKETLKSTFAKILIESTLLDKDNEFDVVVTTGGKIFEEATSTPSPNPTISSISPTPTSTTPTTTLTPSPTPSLTPTP